MSSFKKCLFISFTQFYGTFCFFLINLFKFFVDSGYQPFVECVECKKFFPFCWLPARSNDCFFCCTEAMEFNQIPFVYFGFCCQCFWCFCHEVLAYVYVLNGFAQVFFQAALSVFSFISTLVNMTITCLFSNMLNIFLSHALFFGYQCLFKPSQSVELLFLFQDQTQVPSLL